MAKFKTSATNRVTKPAKNGKLENSVVIFKGVPVTFAKILPHQLDKKINSSDRQWSLDAFIDADTLEQCENIWINKKFPEVDKTKKTMGSNRGKLKYSSKEEPYTEYAGMYGVTLTRDEFDKNGNKNVVKVVDGKGKPLTQEVGHGSICNIKCFAYRKEGDPLVLMLDTVVVVEHNVFERSSSKSQGGYDEDLGIEIPADDEFTTPSEDMSEFEDAPEEDTPPFDEDEMEEDY
jgi:hypothetical protein